MSTLQYLFCFVYAASAVGLIGGVVAQQGEKNGALSSLSGGAGESYYSKHMSGSAEVKKKKLTMALAIGFSVLTAASMFIL